MAMKCCTKLETAKERCPIVFQGHPSNFNVTRYKTSPILTQIRRFRTIGQSQLSNPSDLPCCRFNLWFVLCPCHCSDVCNVLWIGWRYYGTELYSARVYIQADDEFILFFIMFSKCCYLYIIDFTPYCIDQNKDRTNSYVFIDYNSFRWIAVFIVPVNHHHKNTLGISRSFSMWKLSLGITQSSSCL